MRIKLICDKKSRIVSINFFLIASLLLLMVMPLANPADKLLIQ